MSDELGKGSVDGIELIRVIGSTEQVGKGRLYTYTVFVDPRTRARPRMFARTVDRILADQRSWIRGGEVAFKRVAEGADTQVILAAPDTVDRLCYPLNTEGEVSCCQGTKVTINVDRWRHAVPHWTGSIATYRQMVVNHEWGHRIGKGHGYCPGPDKRAPVMQQQTYGMQGCRCNSWPLDAEL